MKYVFVSMFVLISACFATREGYLTEVSKYAGISESDLIGLWGVPDSFTVREGTKQLSYYKKTKEEIPRKETTDKLGVTTVTGGYIVERECTTIFEIENGFVAEVRFDGNGCVA